MTPMRFSAALLRVAALFGLAAGLLAGMFGPAAGPAPTVLAAPISPAAPVNLAAPKALAAPAPVATGTCTVTYTVKSGDYLSKIAAAYGVKWADLAQANSLANPSLIYAGQKLCIPAATTAPVATPAAPVTTTAPTGTPTIQITAVVADQSVTLSAQGFPANQKVDVRMGKNGTLGAGGKIVTTVDSGSGAFTGTYTLPAELKGQGVIAIRLESRWGGYYAYNWFYNNTTK